MKFIDEQLKEYQRFFWCGLINTILTFIIYILVLKIFIYSLAYTISFVSGIFISYYLNCSFVFKKKLSLKSALQYPLVYLAQYLLGVSALYVLVEKFLIQQWLAPLLVLFITVPLTFVMSRRVIKGE
ncbi:MAG: GtrA family protein [Syntrophomonas sp.]